MNDDELLTKEEVRIVRAQLTLLGITNKQIAKRFGATESMVSMSIKGERNSELSQRIRSYVYNLVAEEGGPE